MESGVKQDPFDGGYPGDTGEPEAKAPPPDARAETASVAMEKDEGEVKHFTLLIRGRIKTHGRRGRTLKRLLDKCVILDPHPDVSFGEQEVLIK